MANTTATARCRPKTWSANKISGSKHCAAHNDTGVSVCCNSTEMVG